ncbi:zinc finger, DHHC-type, palmitoyltransferase, ankyrin repeat-containing domain protein [Tanacetum coccineum]
MKRVRHPNVVLLGAITRGADVKAVYLVEQTTLHMSAVRGAIEVAYLLFEECYRVNASDIDIRLVFVDTCQLFAERL